MPSRLSDNGLSHLSSGPKDQKTHIQGGSAHTVSGVDSPKPVTIQHHSDRHIPHTHCLPFSWPMSSRLLPQEGPSFPTLPSPARPGPQPTRPSCYIPCSLFLKPAVYKSSNASSIHLTLNLWRRHRLARTSFSEVILGPVSLIFNCQARLHEEFVFLLPRGRSQ